MMLLAGLFSLAAVVWMIPLIRAGSMSVLASIVLLVGTILGPAFFFVDGPIQISIDRVLWAGLFVVLAVRWRMGQLSIDRPNRVDWVVIALTAWLLLRALGGDPPATGAPPTARWLFYIAMPLGMYVIARCVRLRSIDVRHVTIMLCAIGGYLAVTAICEVSGRHGFVFPSHIVDSEIWEFYGRGRGPLLNPAGNGIVMSMSLAAAILWFLHAGHRGKLLIGTLCVVLLCGIYATLTRSAWLGAGAAVGMIVMVYAPRWVRVLGLASVVLFGGAMAMGLKDQLIRLKRDKNLSAADAEKSIQLRPLLAVVGWEMFKDRPLVGHGFGHYFQNAAPYHEIRSYGLPLQNAKPYAQHNVFLSILIDAGLIGLSLFAAFLLTLGGMGWQLARSRDGPVESRWVGLLMLSTLAAYFCNGMFQDVLIIPMIHMYLFFVAGLTITVYSRGIASLASDPQRAENSQRPENSQSPEHPTPVLTPA